MRTYLALCASLLTVLSGCSADEEQAPSQGGANVPGAPAPAPVANGSDQQQPQQAGAPTPGQTARATTIAKGKFADKALALDNARAVAIAEDGTTYSTHLDAKGEFSLELNTGFSYRIVFANELEGGGQVKLGAITFKTSTGFSEWWKATSTGSFNFGVVSSTSVTSSFESSVSVSTKMDFESKANICLIWPTLPLFPSVAIDAASIDSTEHSTENRADDKTCNHWSSEGKIVWSAEGDIGSYGWIKTGADISGQFGSYAGGSWGGGYSSSFESSYSGGFSSSFSSSWSSNWSSSYSASIGGTVVIAGGVELGAAYEYKSNVKFGGVVNGGAVSGGWSMSSSYSSSVSGSVCSTSKACNQGLSCVANACAKN